MHRDQPSLAVRAGHDAQAFAELYDQYYGRVYTYARYRCNDDRTAEDLTAQVFEKLLVSITNFSPEQGSFEPWLFGLVRHVVGNHLRRQRLMAWLPWEALLNRSAPDPSPEEITIEHDLEAELIRVLPTLKGRERDLIGLRYAGGLTNRQIAELVGLSEQNVRVIIFRAIEKLRRRLDEPAEEGRK
jgi:RNA polymerase sigma factor (sigma-70 family)